MVEPELHKQTGRGDKSRIFLLQEEPRRGARQSARFMGAIHLGWAKLRRVQWLLAPDWVVAWRATVTRQNG